MHPVLWWKKHPPSIYATCKTEKMSNVTISSSRQNQPVRLLIVAVHLDASALFIFGALRTFYIRSRLYPLILCHLCFYLHIANR